MTMGLLAGAGLIATLGVYWLLAQAKRRQGSLPLILAALPFALLMFVIPVPLVALWAIEAFTEVGRTGTATQFDAARLAVAFEPAGSRRWAAVISGIAAFLIFPAAFLLFRQAEVATFLMEAGSTLQNPAMSSIAGMSLDEFSRMISNRLIVSTLAGFAILAVVLMLMAITVFTFRKTAHSEALLMFSRVVFVLAGVVGLWTAYALSLNASAFARVME